MPPPFLHPVGMQHHPQSVASLRDAGWRLELAFLPSYNPYGIKGYVYLSLRYKAPFAK
ncbi:hypothetical protein [Candidatus Symbiothrix dinenymphae]|uniref:hypothetical protein n=1 Tax=Candidatus Symbiothrix dinenymphae TaxID=467085 RepID=UPI000A99D31C|nr:hypothetical protein [Candidatus Symbiothrix dinenymphae]